MLQVFLVAVDVQIVFAGHVQHFGRTFTSLRNLRNGVELFRLADGSGRRCARMKGGRSGRHDPGDRLSERAGDILIRVAGKAGGWLSLIWANVKVGFTGPERPPKEPRCGMPPLMPKQVRAHPGHALSIRAAVDSVVGQ